MGQFLSTCGGLREPLEGDEETASNGTSRPREAPHRPYRGAAGEAASGLDGEQIAMEASLRSAVEEQELRAAKRASYAGDESHTGWVPGMVLLVRDYYTSKRTGKRLSRWRLAEIVDVDSTGDKVCVHYDGWSKRWDEWISPAEEPERFRPLDDSLPTDERDERFTEQMRSIGLAVKEVCGDGNCLFRAVAAQVASDEEQHALFREQACDYLAAHASELQNHVDGDYADYVDRMRRGGEWGSELEIRALESVLARRITIYATHVEEAEPLNTHFGEECDDEGGPPILLSYHGRAHYNALQPVEAVQEGARGGGG